MDPAVSVAVQACQVRVWFEGGRGRVFLVGGIEGPPSCCTASWPWVWTCWSWPVRRPPRVSLCGSLFCACKVHVLAAVGGGVQPPQSLRARHGKQACGWSGKVCSLDICQPSE